MENSSPPPPLRSGKKCGQLYHTTSARDSDDVSTNTDQRISQCGRDVSCFVRLSAGMVGQFGSAPPLCSCTRIERANCYMRRLREAS